MIKQLLASWKTTSAGLLLIGGSVIHLAFSIVQHSANENTYTIAFSAIIGGIGLMFAGDSNVPAPTEAAKNPATPPPGGWPQVAPTQPKP